MFLHDSLPTRRTMRFELRTVWPATHGGDLALVDDVDDQFFWDFVREVSEPPSIVTRSGRRNLHVWRDAKGTSCRPQWRTLYCRTPVAHR